MNRVIGALVVLLVVQVAILGSRYVGSDDASPLKPGGKLLAEVSVDRVASIEIRDQQGKTIELTRDGAGFAVASAGGYPCEGSKVEDLLGKLVHLRSEEIVARSAQSHGKLGVRIGAAEREITFKDGSGEEIGRLFLGRYVAGGQYARISGQDTVHRTSESLTYQCSTSPTQYVDPQLVTFDQEKVESVTWLEGDVVALAVTREIPEGSTEPVWRAVARTGEGAEETFDADGGKVKRVLQSLSGLRFKEPVGTGGKAGFGLDPAATTIRVGLPENESIELHVGNVVPDAGEDRYAQKVGNPFVVTLASYTIKNLLKEADDLRPEVAEEPESTPSDAASGPEEARSEGAPAVDSIAPGKGAPAAPEMEPAPVTAEVSAPEAPKAEPAPASETEAAPITPKTQPAPETAPAPSTPKATPAPARDAPKAEPAPAPETPQADEGA
jgi:hypothetical protein